MKTKTHFTALLITSMLLCTSLLAISIQPPLSAATIPRGGWQTQDSGVTQDLTSVQFVCLNRGAIAGNQGTILSTGNGGNNWTIQNSGVQYNIYEISYFWYNVAVAVGDAGTILFTNDGGQTWNIRQTDMMESYFAAQMINETFGVAVGVNALFQPFFTRTDDGWTTWDSTCFYIEHDSTMYEGRLTDVSFVNSSVGYVSARVDMPAGGAIAKTVDGGATWQTIYFSSTAYYGIDTTWNGSIYAVGDSGAIIQSTDGGLTWNEQSSGVTKQLNAVDFPSDTVGFAVGEHGIILRTNDAGATWTQQSSGVTSSLKSVSFMGESFGTVVGEGGIILHTQTGGMDDDNWPPETTYTLDGTLEGDVYTSNVTVTLTATDNISGVFETSYSLDNESWTTYTSPFVVSSNGAHLLVFHSMDNAGNVEENKTCEFTIEKKTLEISITGGLSVHVSVTNLGAENITMPWNISLEGGLIVFGKSVSGNVTLLPGESALLKDFVIGLGRTQITFTLGSLKEMANATVLLFFIQMQ
jgi:photosystem II stability/assembly factor-like uncharacterized protein